MMPAKKQAKSNMHGLPFKSGDSLSLIRSFNLHKFVYALSYAKLKFLMGYKKIYRTDYTATLVGFVGYFLALTPSLLPRPPLFLGVVAGIGYAIGYAFGLLIAKIIPWLGIKNPSEKIKLILKRVILVALIILVPYFGIEAARWQNELRALVDEKPLAGYDVFRVIIVSFVTASLILLATRALERFYRYLQRIIKNISYIPERFARALSTFLFISIIVLIFNGILPNAFVDVTSRFYASKNDRTDTGTKVPVSSFKSGSKGSYVDWQSLGRQGRNFVALGPSQQQIAGFSHQKVSEPIRIYVGARSAPTPEKRVDLAMKELERTDAFRRKYLAVILPTGTGWVESQLVDSFEYIHNGDTAIVAVQYSWLPSWISTLADRSDSSQTARLLFDKVYEKWSIMPAANRPKLIVSGWSLGAYGLGSVFSGAHDISARTDGAFFTGMPNFTKLWQEFTYNRDKGSPEILPVYHEGKTVRFASTVDDITRNQNDWNLPRVLLLQHATDPVPWCSPDLIFRRPDWLEEPRAYDVSPKMRWYPFITFVQVTIDLFSGIKTPSGHGHNYQNTIIDGWLAVTPPDGWSDAETKKLQAIIGVPSSE